MICNFTQRSSKLNSGCTRTHNDKCQPCGSFLWVLCSFSRFEGEQNLMTNHSGFFNALQARRPLAPRIMSKVRAL